MNFILDTNILIHLIRQTPNVMQQLNNKGVFGIQNQTFISIVTIAEIQAFAYRNNWGTPKLKLLQKLITTLTPIPIDNQSIIDDYVLIDAYSQGKHRTQPLKGISARNMGKNDLWIAATTCFANGSMVTSDADFDHLNNVFFNVEKIII
jgi:tRNA(fMet)-specific endonuclease VapC